MKYILPSESFVSYEYLSIPSSVDITDNTVAYIQDALGRMVSMDLKLKVHNDVFYVPWNTPSLSGAYTLGLVDNGVERFKTNFYVLNESQARHTPNNLTIPHPLPPVFFSGDPLFPDSINIYIRTNFGLPLDPNFISYQYLRSTGVPLSSVLTPTRYAAGKYYAPGSLNLPGGEHLVRWSWKINSDSPVHSLDKPVAVINYNSYSTSPGVCAGNVGYVCCSSSPCKCLSNC